MVLLTPGRQGVEGALRAGERVFKFPSVLNYKPASTALGMCSCHRSTSYIVINLLFFKG
jgi:hypothetical protein